MGPFVNDVIDMSQNGHVEDYENTMFRVMAMKLCKESMFLDRLVNVDSRGIVR